MKRVITSVFFALVCATVAAAQENCSALWSYNTVSYQNDLKKTLAIVYSIDRDNFEERKREFGSGLTMPVDGVPISGYANYNEFDSARKRISSRFSYSLDLQQSENYLRQFVDPDSVAAVKACLANQFGLHAVLDRVQGETVLISLHWKPTAGSSNPIDPLVATVIGGQLIGDFPTELGPHNWVAVTYSRNKNLDYIFRAQGSGSISQPIVVPADPVIDAKTYFWRFSKTEKPLGFDPDEWDSNIICDEGAVVVGEAQNGTVLSYPFSGRTHVSVQPRHARIGDDHYSRVIVNGSPLRGGYKLHTIVVTCNP